jgi:hypothetical protein
VIKYQSEGIRKGEPIQHREARRAVQLYLEIKGRSCKTNTDILFDPKFIKLHKLENRFAGHSYDIITDDEVIEIDGINTRHSKKRQKINDGIASAYIEWLGGTTKFYRLLQDEITDPQGRLLDPKDVAAYLRENLF